MAAPTQISRGVSIQGTLQAAEDVSLLGRVSGRVESEAAFIVEEGAFLEAETHVRQLIVHGIVVGDVYAVERVEVGPTGQIKGAIRTAQLRLVPGGRIAGRVETGVEVARKRFSAGPTTSMGTPTARTSASVGVRPAGPPEPAPEPPRPRRPAFVEPAPVVRTPDIVEAAPGRERV